MIVIKRNGARQEFDEAKIRSSIEITSDEIGQPMSSGDLNYAVKAIVKRLREGGRKEIPSRDIHIVVVGELICQGFYPVAKAYDESVKSFVHQK